MFHWSRPPDVLGENVRGREENHLINAVHVEGLTKEFGKFRVVDNVAFEIKKGEIFGFLGPNGAGKSTTIKMLCGVLQPTRGKGHILDWDITKDAYVIRHNIGYMSQKLGLYNDLTVAENLDFAGTMVGLSGKRLVERREELLRQFDIAEFRRQVAGLLPTGFRQRLALACALIHDPPILFLDEPTSGVDPQTRRKFWDMLYGLSERGVTMMVTTHYMDEAEYCNMLGFITGGKLAAIGTPTGIKRNLGDRYLWEVWADSTEEAHKALSALPGVTAVSQHGLALRVVSRQDLNPEGDGLTRYLESFGINVQGVDTVAPTLEDVFTDLAMEQGRRLP